MKLALSAGHHNTDGGNHLEQELVGPITQAVAKHARRLGIDVRVITPGDGLGMFPGGLWEVANTVVKWAKGRPPWVADLFLEVHAEDNGRGDAGRGCFVIYPDWGNDIDTAVRDRLGPRICRAIKAATKIPVRGTGVMSEKQTFVATEYKARLGIFRVTKVLAKTNRAIVEVGSYGSPADLRIMRAPAFPDAIGKAIAEAIATHYGVKTPTPSTPTLPASYVVRFNQTNVREAPNTDAPIAWNGTAVLSADQRVSIADIVTGEQLERTVSGTVVTSNQWAHWVEVRNGVRLENGFIWLPLLQPAQVGQ